jgi:hypothetical protein
LVQKKFKKSLTPARTSGRLSPHTVKNNANTTNQMKKTLLMAAAALAASVISSQAQVYSQNIVGYVNKPLPTGFNIVANPMDYSSGNAATNFVDNSGGVYDGSLVYIWNGSSFTVVQYDSSQTTGFANALGNAAVPAPILNPGQAFFLNNQSGTSNTVTFVGTVHVDGAASGTNVVGLTTNVLSGSLTYVYVSSKLPVAGGVSAVLGLKNDLAGTLDGSLILIPNIVGGNVNGYTTIQFDSTQPTGFANALGNASVPEPVIQVGSGFFFSNQTGGNYNWIQSY